MRSASPSRVVPAFLLCLLCASPAAGQSVHPTIGAGTDPAAIAIDPVTNKVYVANQTSNDVTVIDK